MVCTADQAQRKPEIPASRSPTTFATCSAFPATCAAFPFFEVRQVFACPICIFPDGVDLNKVGSCHKTKLIITQRFVSCNWPRGVTVSTLDSESSDRGFKSARGLLVFVHTSPLHWHTFCWEFYDHVAFMQACSYATLPRQRSFYFVQCPRLRFVWS